MRYLEINLDPFITLNRVAQQPLSHPLHLLGYVEATGVASLSFTYSPEVSEIVSVPAIRAATRCRLNIRANADLTSIQKAMQLKPDFITLVDLSHPLQVFDAQSKDARDLVETIQSAEDFNLILRLMPEVEQLKAAYRLKVDEVEVATNELAHQDTHQNFLLYLDQLVHVIRVGQKNKLRVSVGGNLDARLIRTILQVVEVEFISIGRALLSQALVHGFGQALKEFVNLTETI
jgi:pyridoxine 5'-phosphate synthase PdxJ